MFKKLIAALLSLSVVMSFGLSALSVSASDAENSLVNSEAPAPKKVIVKVVREDENAIQPRMNQSFNVTLVDEKYKLLMGDNNFFEENVTVLVVSLTSNIQSIDLHVKIGRYGLPDEFYGLTENSTAEFTAAFSAGYDIFVKVAEGSVSVMNPGVVRMHVSDL